MDTDKLEAFLCLARHKNFTKASEELFISQPALSKKMADFERELEATLLVRDNRHVELTDAGKALAADAPAILGVLDALKKKVQNIDHNPDLFLHIACSGIEYGRFGKILDGFRDRYPEVTIQLDWYKANIVKRMLENNTADCGFQLGTDLPSEPNVEHVLFLRDTFSAVVPLNHPLAKKRRVSVKDLEEDTFVFMRQDDEEGPFNNMVNCLNAMELCPKGGFKIVDSVDSAVLNIGAGFGVGMLMTQVAFRYNGLVKFIPLMDCSWQVEIHLVWNRMNQNPANRLFVDYVKEQNKIEKMEEIS